MKVAIVYDRVTTYGGAETVLLALHQIWPDAPLFTAFYHRQAAPWADSFPQVTASFLNKLPFASRHHEWFAWATPIAFESFNFTPYDLVISVTSAEAKGIITSPDTRHICYLLTPTRYLWSHTHLHTRSSYSLTSNPLGRLLATPLISRLRNWDFLAASRPDHFIAISQTVKNRAAKYYRRPVDAVIYPPVTPIAKSKKTYSNLPTNYYLLVSRLVPYKRVDIAVEAFNRLGLPLVIVGSGALETKLRRRAQKNIIFQGFVSRDKLSYLYHHASAVIFPSEEDFGIVPVEAQSAGVPVIAYAKGGASETVIAGKTGLFFHHHTPPSLARAVAKFSSLKLKSSHCRQNAANYSLDKFRTLLLQYIDSL